MDKKWVGVIAVALAGAVVACAAHPSEGRRGSAASEARGVMAEDAGAPSCPGNALPLCVISNIDLSGGPRPSNQCTPLIDVAFDSGETSFTWESSSGQLVHAVVVQAGSSSNVYTYDPAVSEDDAALGAPSHAQLSTILFCGTLGAHQDAGTDDAASDDAATDDAATEEPADGGGGGKAW